MTTEKFAISLPEPLARRARRAVRAGRAKSVSAYVAAALEEKAKLDDPASLLEEMPGETGGLPTFSARAHEVTGSRRPTQPTSAPWTRRYT